MIVDVRSGMHMRPTWGENCVGGYYGLDEKSIEKIHIIRLDYGAEIFGDESEVKNQEEVFFWLSIHGFGRTGDKE